MLNHDPAAKTHDRIGFTLSMAIALHVAVVLGLGFAMNIPEASRSSRLDITLSTHKSDSAVLDADFIAQTNQQASGSDTAKKELTTSHLAEVNSANIQQTQTQLELQASPSEQSLSVLSSSAANKRGASTTKVDSNSNADANAANDAFQRQLEIASLQAKLDKEQQVYARLPRVRRTTAVATKAAFDAE